MQASPVGEPADRRQTTSAAELIERCSVHNCEASWQEFLDRFGWALSTSIRRALTRMAPTLSPDLHDDLVQEAWCRLLGDRRRRLRACRGTNDQAVSGYLARVADSVVKDHLRRALAAKRGRDVTCGQSGPDGPGRVDLAADPHSSADRSHLVEESRRLFFAEASRVLAGRHRRRNLWVVYLALFEGWTSREISERLHALTISNVDSIVYRCRIRLREAGFHLPRLRDAL